MAKRTTFLDLAVVAIEAKQEPLTCAEIIKWGKAKSALRTTGKTPEKTLHASLSRSIENDPHSPFVKEARGKFGLRYGGRKSTARK